MGISTQSPRGSDAALVPSFCSLFLGALSSQPLLRGAFLESVVAASRFAQQSFGAAVIVRLLSLSRLVQAFAGESLITDTPVSPACVHVAVLLVPRAEAFAAVSTSHGHG